LRRITFVLGPLAVALGLTAEWVSFGWDKPIQWIPDLAVGWFLIGCGLFGLRRRPESRAGALMTATGFTWFIGNFATLGDGTVSWLAANAQFLHRGTLLHLVLTFPSGRATSRLARVAVLFGYVAALTPPLWRNDIATMMISAAFVVVASVQYSQAFGESRRARRITLRATAVVGLVLGGTALARLIVPLGDIRIPWLGAYAATELLIYEATLVIVVGALLRGLLKAPWQRTEVTDLMVELGEIGGGTVRDQLARALGDPSLEVGYWDRDANVYVDTSGRTLAIPVAGNRRSMTKIELGSQPVAALIHDAAVLSDPGLIEAVSSAAELAASNARLQMAVEGRLTELKASRRRILEAGDEQRRLLERRLRDGAERRLNRLGSILHDARSEHVSPATAERIDRVENKLTKTLEDLRELARGLHPRDLSEHGLEASIVSLCDNLPIPVEIKVTLMPLTPQLEAASYFLCSEAITNVAKHASASRVKVAVDSDGATLIVTIEDDGVGEADPSKGSGLRGLRDRVESLGGKLQVWSEPGRGTRLAAEIPLSGENTTGN
jgi:signal transduction histidine kinase